MCETPNPFLYFGCPIIDCRSINSPGLLLRHIKGAASIPAGEWYDRALELPPRCTKFSLLVDDSAECTALLSLENPLMQDLQTVFHDSDELFWGSIPSHLIESGEWPLGNRGCLWRPGPLTHTLSLRWREWGLPCGPGSSASLLDCGCGQGRNAVYLMLTLCGVCVSSLTLVGVDNRRPMIEKLAKFSARTLTPLGVTSYVRCAEATPETRQRLLEAGRDIPLAAPHRLFSIQDELSSYLKGCRLRDSSVHCNPEDWCPPLSLTRKIQVGEKEEEEVGGKDGSITGGEPLSESDGPQLSSLRGPPQSFDVILFMRFINRECIISSIDSLAPRGGIIAVETFHTSTPHPTHRESQLERGELCELLKTRGGGGERGDWLVTLVHEDIAFAEDGRPLLQAVVWVFPAPPPSPQQ